MGNGGEEEDDDEKKKGKEKHRPRILDFIVDLFPSVPAGINFFKFPESIWWIIFIAIVQTRKKEWRNGAKEGWKREKKEETKENK